MEFSSKTARLASLLMMLSLMSTILGARIDIYREGEEKLKEDMETEENMSFTGDHLNTFQSEAKRIANRIGNGHPTMPGQIPWQGRVMRAHGNGYVHHCGASIIDEFWLLSAVHCFTGTNIKELLIIVGDHSTSQQDRAEQIFDVEDIIMHKDYNKYGKYDSDIALVRIQPTSDGRGIQFNSFVNKIPLPDQGTHVKDGTQCIISGWGLNRYGYPDILLAANVPIVGQQTCQKSFDTVVTKNMICAGDLRNGVATCGGDSGGPLVCNIRGYNVLIGITSWGSTGCAEVNKPAVYVRVPAFRSWITSKTGL